MNAQTLSVAIDSHSQDYFASGSISPAAAYLAQMNTATSLRTAQSALFGALLVFNPPGLSSVISDLEQSGLHRHHAIHLFKWQRLTYQDISLLRGEVEKRYSAHRANYTLSAVRRVLGECWRLNLMTRDTYERVADIERIIFDHEPAGRVVSDEEIAILFTTIRQHGLAGVRDVAILGLLLTCGLRRSEISSLNLDHYNPLEDTLLIHGKGQKQRLVYVVNQTKILLQNWLDLRGQEGEPMFTKVVANATLKGRMWEGNKRLTAHGIYCMFKIYETEAGLEPFSLHDFRRTFITRLLEKGVDVLTVSKLAGHASPSTTGRYDRRAEEVKRNATELLNFL